MRKLLLLLTSLLLITSGCGKTHHRVYHIGIDPTFFPLELLQQSVNVFAFSNELLQEISKVEKVQLLRTNLSWDNLLDGMKLKKCEAIFSSISPNLINQTKFSFSDPYLKTGPVLVMPVANENLTFSDLDGRVIAIEHNDTEIELMSKHPAVEYDFYDRIPNVLEEVVLGKYHGALVPTIPAHTYIRDIYHDTLSITTQPLTNEALRLITYKETHPELINIFNSGLSKLKKSGKYDELLEKWFKTTTS